MQQLTFQECLSRVITGLSGIPPGMPTPAAYRDIFLFSYRLRDQIRHSFPEFVAHRALIGIDITRYTTPPGSSMIMPAASMPTSHTPAQHGMIHRYSFGAQVMVGV